MNETDKTTKLAQYRSHRDMGMAGYESDMDQLHLDMVSPRHAMRMEDLTLTERLRHMTAGEMLRAVLLCVACLAAVKLLIMTMWVLYDVQAHGLFG